MNSFKPFAAFAVVCLIAEAALADQCKPIDGRTGPTSFLGPCTYEGTAYADCYARPVYGTINGIMRQFAPENNWVCLAWMPPEYGCQPAPPPPYSPLAAGYVATVFETQKGKLYAQGTWVWNLSLWSLPDGTEALFPTVDISVISGGTDHYEGTSGWIGFIMDDGTWKGFMKGELCASDPED